MKPFIDITKFVKGPYVKMLSKNDILGCQIFPCVKEALHI